MIELPDHFFEDIWQQQPCVLRNATNWRPAIGPDELAGIACEEDGDARIILENLHIGSNQPERWVLEHGPFTEQRFSHLPKSHWTLLVRQLEHWDDKVKELLEEVPRLPRWRLEDVMASYAVDQGSVGPHYDFYDVFLVQGTGKRLWRVSGPCDHLTPRLDHENLLLLRELTPTAEYLLEPGDILYVPAGYAHWGIAQGDCMTFSVGFRAPSISEAFSELGELMSLDPTAQARRLPDTPEIILNESSGVSNDKYELKTSSVTHARQWLMSQLDDLIVAQWLGRHVTLSASSDEFHESECQEEYSDAKLQEITCFDKWSELRMFWHQHKSKSYLFCSGQCLTGQFSSKLLEAVCMAQTIDLEAKAFEPLEDTLIIVRWLLSLNAVQIDPCCDGIEADEQPNAVRRSPSD